MPGKSRRKRSRAPQTRKARSGQRPAAAVQAPAADVPSGPMSRPHGSPPTAQAAQSEAPSAPIRYPHMAVELRTIGILAAVMIAVLLVLYAVLG